MVYDALKMGDTVWDKVCLSPVLELLFSVGDAIVSTDNIRAPLDTSPGFSESLSDVSGFLVLVWVNLGCPLG